ncbi:MULTISPECIES: hypothetical protein [unclassified Methylobacterium]|uniref:hypothetical protein n=1 Tax=unclassified Methylobacterium TaxID=2615210 RepID=UPI0006F66C76|nr:MULTISPECIES: hypothetical protein [unclassified Methylobacterium]KQP13484.1 hypothetical protein ASF26_19130 [Methylobacterium sp. Leaf93]TXN41127.1 hypothetical protein FV225_03465 [Methylobacterium sp. WL93]TXN51470.1 hypothetical protein FV227_07665 [Methylobacterium sp. WL119]TXN63795.1 hypothetical protein FV232_22385 [Methylobacterium sp. WL30]
MSDVKPEPVIETFTRVDAPPGEIVFTPLPVGELAGHALFLASQLSNVNRKRVAKEACAAWIATSDWFRQQTPDALVVWFKPGPPGYDGVYLTPEKGAKKLKPAPAVILLRDGAYRLLDKREIAAAVGPLLEAQPEILAPPDPEDAKYLGRLAP